MKHEETGGMKSLLHALLVTFSCSSGSRCQQCL